MRIVGMVLVLLGGLSLGYQGFESAVANTDEPVEVARDQHKGADDVPPVAGGIAVVSGLLLLTSSTRRDEG